MSLNDKMSRHTPELRELYSSQYRPSQGRLLSWPRSSEVAAAKLWLVVPLVAVCLAACGPARNDTIACPKPQAGKAGGPVPETPAAIAAAGARLTSGGENAILEIAGEVRSRQPNASQAEIVNYLVTAYCPEMNRRNAFDLSAKRSAVEAFAVRAGKIVSSLPAS